MKKCLYLYALLCLFLVTSVVGVAYFHHTLDGTNHSATTSPTDNSVIKVATFEEFVDATYEYSDSKNTGSMDQFNPNDITADVLNRKTIRLLNDILFTSDVLVNRDCHIDLGQNAIDLQGHDLNIKNHYDGTFAIYNGKIIDSGFKVVEGEKTSIYYGNIIIDCPNAVVDFPDTVIADNVNTQIITVDEEAVCYSTMELILANISNNGFNDFYNSKTDTFIESRTDICKLHNNENSDYCIYTYTDLDFIKDYYSYDVNVTYTSDNTNNLSNSGRVKVDDTSTLASLKITITYNDTSLEKNINVHILTVEDYAEASVYVLLQYLSKYYDMTNKLYIFDKTFYLPTRNEYFDSDYEFIVSSEDDSYSSNNLNDFFGSVDGENVLAVNLNSDITDLVISASSNDSTYTSEKNSVSGQSSSLVDDDHTYALNIKNHLYGNQITINNLQATDSGYTQKELLTDVNLNGYTRLSSISYDFDNNYEKTYLLDEIPNNDTHILLHVNEDSLPYVGQSVQLMMKFTFTNGKIITLPVPIKYEPIISDNATGFERFDPYYAYFNKEFIKTTNQYTYNSFDIPLSYNQLYPIYTFVIYEIQEDGSYVEMTTSAPGLFNISVSDNKTFTQFDANTKTKIDINPYYIEENDTRYALVYIPISKDLLGNIIYWGDKVYSTDINDIVTEAFVANLDSYKYKSILTIPGIVRYQCDDSVKNERFADKELYTIAYELINGEGTYADGETFILTNTLKTSIGKVDFSNDSLLLEYYNYSINLTDSDEVGQINSFKGINLLTGIKNLDFNGTSLLTDGELNIEEIRYISQITNLEELDLSSTGIYDRQQSNLAFPTGDNNELLDILSNLNNLKVLNLSNNKIYNFSGLTDFASLEKVDVTNNSFQCTAFTGYVSFLNPVFNTIVNAIYGSSGATNTSTFVSLKMDNIDVVGAMSANDLGPELQAIVDALTSLEYQDKLMTDLPIDLIYSNFPNTFGEYGLYQSFDKEYETEDGTTEVTYSFVSISFSHNGTDERGTDATKFTITITYNCKYIIIFFEGNQEVTFQYDYDITRY